MSDKKYTQAELNNMKYFEYLMQLKMIKKGLIVTERQVDALNHFFGDVFKQMSTIKPTVITINFDDEGNATRSDNVAMEMTANDIVIPRKPLEGNNELQDS